MRKLKEIIVLATIIALMVVLAVFLATKKSGSVVRITDDNKVLYTLELEKDAKIVLEHNTVIIKDGKVWVREADCKNQICVNTPAIDSSGGAIICLPNKVAVEVINNEN